MTDQEKLENLLRKVPVMIPANPNHEDALIWLEMTIGGSMVDAIVEREFTPVEAASIIVNGNEEWEPIEEQNIASLIGILENIW